MFQQIAERASLMYSVGLKKLLVAIYFKRCAIGGKSEIEKWMSVHDSTPRKGWLYAVFDSPTFQVIKAIEINELKQCAKSDLIMLTERLERQKIFNFYTYFGINLTFQHATYLSVICSSMKTKYLFASF